MALQELCRSLRLSLGKSFCRAGAWQKVAGRQGTPEVGSSMKMMLGLATSSTAMVRRLRCSTLRPLDPGLPTSASLHSHENFEDVNQYGRACLRVMCMVETGN